MLYGVWSCKDNVECYALNFKYAHGQLESILQYDVLASDSKEELEMLENIEDKGIVNLEITLPNEDILSCKAFIWKAEGFPYNKGLVVLDDDIKALEYAARCMNEKRTIL